MLWKSKQGFTAAMESRLDECVGRVMWGGGEGGGQAEDERMMAMNQQPGSRLYYRTHLLL